MANLKQPSNSKNSRTSCNLFIEKKVWNKDGEKP